jgi:hypothetical protein
LLAESGNLSSVVVVMSELELLMDEQFCLETWLFRESVLPPNSLDLSMNMYLLKVGLGKLSEGLTKGVSAIWDNNAVVGFYLLRICE